MKKRPRREKKARDAIGRAPVVADSQRFPRDAVWISFLVVPVMLSVAIAALFGLYATNVSEVVLLAIIGPLVGIPVFALVTFRVGKASAGDDGLVVMIYGRSRFIAYRDIAAVDHTETAITLRLEDGRRVSIRLLSAPTVKNARSTLYPPGTEFWRRLQRGFEEARSARELPSAHALARGRRTEDEWLASIEQHASDPGDYRTPPLDRSELALLLRRGTADVSARLGATLVLRKLGMSKSERATLRNAAESTLHPKVRVALEAAIDDTADEASVQAAARAAVR